MADATPAVTVGEQPAQVFVSSVMDPELDAPRQEVVAALQSMSPLVPWAFEYTAASEEPPAAAFLHQVAASQIVIWLVGSRTTPPVIDEVREALRLGLRLLVIKLPAAARDTSTVDLLEEISNRAKYMNAEDAGGPGPAAALSVQGAIIRALRAGLPEQAGRPALLDRLVGLSRGRSVERWQAAGVPRQTALELADDPSVGLPKSDILPGEEHPLRVLVGEAGGGKSLAAERVFQRWIAEAMSDQGAPVPVYLEAASARSDLEARVREELGSQGDPWDSGAAVVIDAAEQPEPSVADDVLRQARILAAAWPNARFLITSRRLPALNGIEEVVAVPLLDEPQSERLIRRVAGRAPIYGLTSSLREMLKRPLFALFYASWLLSKTPDTPRSTAQLIGHMVGRVAPWEGSDQGLRRLGTAALDGEGVASRQAFSAAERGGLLTSGLVIEEGSKLRFPLVLFAEWFAAQGLIEGNPPLEDLLDDEPRLDRWRYAITAAVGTSDDDTADRLLEPLARARPALAAQVVQDSVATWGTEPLGDPPPSHQAGEQLVRATRAWADGTGPLAALIAPVTKDGDLRPLGISSSPSGLLTSWYKGEGEKAPVLEISGPELDRREWPGFRMANPGASVAWSWRWSLEDLVSALKPLLDHQILIEGSSLRREAAWAEALALMGHGSLYNRAVTVEEVTERLDGLSPESVVMSGGNFLRPRYIQDELARLREVGENRLEPPWPTDDQNRAHFVRGGYSDEQLVRRATAVYGAALEGYAAIVERWFAPFADRLRWATAMPLRLK